MKTLFYEKKKARLVVRRWASRVAVGVSFLHGYTQGLTKMIS